MEKIMALKKSYSRSKNLCKVTFTCLANDANAAWLVGDFNGWDKMATPMKKDKKGFSATLSLEPGQAYEFRYFLSGEKWANDDAADGYAETSFTDAENCICNV